MVFHPCRILWRVHRKTQEARILELLDRARGAWAPSPELAAVSLQYNARVYPLRRLGFTIENRVETTRDGIRRGFIRLHMGQPFLHLGLSADHVLTNQPQEEIARPYRVDQPATAPIERYSTLPLFADNQRDRRYSG